MRNTFKISILATLIMGTFLQCNTETKKVENEDSFKYQIDQFADIKILRFKVDGFEELTLKQKQLVYFLNMAALEGRDIMFDQNYKHNITIRKTLEAIYNNFAGDKESDDFKNFEIYLKRVWFSNGIHHHYSCDKFVPECSQDFMRLAINQLPQEILPMLENISKSEFIDWIIPIMYNPKIDAKRVNQADGEDLIATSANNYYGEGITQKEVEDFYETMKDTTDKTPISYGLNSKLIKENGKLVEIVWKQDGMYSSAISRIVGWLEKALTVTENPMQHNTLTLLIDYYKTGNLRTFDAFNIAWLADTVSHIDFVNGFTETYGDPLGIKASWESIVNFKNLEATKRAETISSNAQWFEDNSPVEHRFKKKTVKGVTAKVITVTMLGGDCYPATPIGINLPNADWIRKEHGSKSVTIENITEAYDKSSLGSGMLEAFCYNEKEIERTKKYGFLTNNIHVDLHECLGHGSGQLLPNVKGDELKAYSSTIEETRADLFGLYYIMDKKMVELGLLPNLEAAQAEYDAYIRNGLLTQLVRIEKGKNIEESHMRNRQLIAAWCFDKGSAENVIERKLRDGNSYFVINNYEKLRTLIGELLAEVQRIKSEGDYIAGRELVEKYAVNVDQNLLNEVHERYAKLKLAPYAGFVNPEYKPLYDANNQIIDITISYPENYVEQMREYGKKHSWL